MALFCEFVCPWGFSFLMCDVEGWASRASDSVDTGFGFVPPFNYQEEIELGDLPINRL